MTQALGHELELQRHFLGPSEKVDTIYFGGGTPSLLSYPQIEYLLNKVDKIFGLSCAIEVTFEINPEDVGLQSLRVWKQLGINRLSIGLQSFDDEILKYLNRQHTGEAGIRAIHVAQEEGFDNISGDLIYAIPQLNIDQWQRNLTQIIDLNIPHISLYSLTIEEKTVFGNWKKRGQLTEVPDHQNGEQYEMAVSMLNGKGYEHYEVSSFAQPGYRSKHNSSYWNDKAYLGIGPGAHSYNKGSRFFNIRSNHLYLRALEENRLPAEKEVLTTVEKINEYLLTGLRTREGIDLTLLKKNYQLNLEKKYPEFFQKLLDESWAENKNNHLSLTSAGMARADEIILHFFQDEHS